MTWNEALAEEHKKDYYKELFNFVCDECREKTIYPPSDKIMNATALTPLDEVKVVILGQDPYHQPNQAMGLAFSVNKGITIPRSLKNIFKELQDELGCYIPNHGDLTCWAKQGVLLLNSTLTVEHSHPLSHRGHGWEQYTDAIIKAVNEQDRPIVYLLWGKAAQEKATLITNPRHLVLKTSHPSPYAVNYGFFGCGHFAKCNEYLQSCGVTPINWQLENI
jgi:uracil-DNA glycosylase